MKLMILGYARHGKDTVAEILAKNFGMTFRSSSLFASERVMMPYFQGIGKPYATVEECFADRVNHRQEWYDQIKAYNTPDTARLARALYAEADIYVGIRSATELAGIEAEGLFDYSIWVDRSKHVAPEPETSNTLVPGKADYVLDNNGTLEQLVKRVRNLYWDLVGLEVAGRYEKGR